ncbi:hypothetical protein Dimus_027556 [Dionaea muscipula]
MHQADTWPPLYVANMSIHLKITTSLSLPLVSLLILVCLLFTNTIHANQDHDLIHESCQRTPYPRTCESTLRLDPRSGNQGSVGLALIMIDVVKLRFADSLGTVNRLILKKAWDVDDQLDETTVKALRRCASLYKVVLEADVPVAREAVEKGDPKFGVDSMVDSSIEADACERGLVAAGKLRSLLTEKNKKLQEISNVAAALIKLLME